MVLAGPPGTSKTWVAKHIARYLTQDNKSAIKTVQFHPSFGYEEFIEGLRPVVDPVSGAIQFKEVSGVVMKMAEDCTDSDNPHILIIDEMNRANLPRVFGELMYLFEYRGDHEAIDLQYSKDFSLPPNLLFIGTMNTADRSIRSIDIALRRRFEVIDCPPDRNILEQYYQNDAHTNSVPSLIDGFDSLNTRLEEALDRHHLVGHTFFMKPQMTLSLLRKTWTRKLGPLIEEYFFDQPDLAAEFLPEEFWPELSAQ